MRRRALGVVQAIDLVAAGAALLQAEISDHFLVADACEAVIAALFLDGGLDAAAGFIRDGWAEMIAEAPAPPVDAKTRLQEWAQGRGLTLPSYAETARQGPEHSPQFTVEAGVEGYPAVAGTGASKRAAEQSAAAALLAKLGEDIA